MTDTQYSAIVQRTLDEKSSKLHDISQYLWSNPEIGRQEEKAHAALTDLLEKEGFQVQRHAHSPTGFIASFSSSSSTPHVAFMCEYDALPDIGHACGHNLIAISAVGAGLAVKAAMIDLGLSGRVTVLGTPAEETDGGKIDFIEAGFFKDVDAAIMAHPVGGLENMLIVKTTACSDFSVEFEGKCAHAASSPWEGVNALDAAFQAYQNVSNLRQHILPTCRIGTVITEGGKASNIIPDKTKMHFSLRAPSTNEMNSLQQRWRACIEAAALATGCKHRIDIECKPFNEVITNVELANVYEKHSKTQDVFYTRHFVDAGSTDMGNVTREVPGLHPYYHINISGSDAHEAEFAKHTRTETAEKYAMKQAYTYAMTALEVLTDEDLRKRMKAEFDEWKISH